MIWLGVNVVNICGVLRLAGSGCPYVAVVSIWFTSCKVGDDTSLGKGSRGRRRPAIEHYIERSGTGKRLLWLLLAG